MKNVLTIAVFFSLFLSSSALAVSNNVDDPKAVPAGSIIQQSRNKEALNDAIYQHQKKYYNEKERSRWDKNIYYRMTRAAQARKEGHVASHATTMVREGELTDWSNTREFQQPSFYRPNSKAVFRRCIVNYYFEGGDCSSDELKEGLIYGSVHTVNRVPNAFWTRDIEVINALRNIQRKMDKPEKVGAGQQRQRAINNGDVGRSYVSPYTKTYFTPDEE